jgi:hypothetical protein
LSDRPRPHHSLVANAFHTPLARTPFSNSGLRSLRTCRRRAERQGIPGIPLRSFCVQPRPAHSCKPKDGSVTTVTLFPWVGARVCFGKPQLDLLLRLLTKVLALADLPTRPRLSVGVQRSTLVTSRTRVSRISRPMCSTRLSCNARLHLCAVVKFRRNSEKTFERTSVVSARRRSDDQFPSFAH